jgi:methionyl-tRNA synthetase
MTNEIVLSIFTVTVLPILGILTNFIVKLINSKVEEVQERINNQTINKYIDMAQKVVRISVDSVTQTFVESLKSQKKFDERAAKEAFNLAKSRALSTLSIEIKENLECVFGDLNIWLDSTIEAYIINSKPYTPLLGESSPQEAPIVLPVVDSNIATI